MSGNLSWGALSGIGVDDVHLTPVGTMNSKHVSIMKVDTSRKSYPNGETLGILQFPPSIHPDGNARQGQHLSHAPENHNTETDHLDLVRNYGHQYRLWCHTLPLAFLVLPSCLCILGSSSTRANMRATAAQRQIEHLSFGNRDFHRSVVQHNSIHHPMES